MRSTAAVLFLVAVGPSLPAPTGSYPVGTVVAYLTDSTRADSDFPRGRPITLQLWYPASTGPGAEAKYLLEPGLLAALQRGYYEQDSSVLAAWQDLPTHASASRPPAPGPHPLITFSVGLGVVRANYTTIAEELASRGYIVALVESPLAGLMVLPSGQIVEDTVGRFNDIAAHRAALTAWSGDVTYLLDLLQQRVPPMPLAPVGATIDWHRVAAAGHSSGGLVAIATCERDPRVQLCIDLDGGFSSPAGEPLADFVTTGVRKPTLVLRSRPLYSDADFKRRGLTREQWEARGAAGRAALDSLAQRSGGRLWEASIGGTGHFSFSDAPYVMPTTITRFGGSIIAPGRGLEVMTGTMRMFLESGWTGGVVLAAAAGVYPELAITRTGGN